MRWMWILASVVAAVFVAGLCFLYFVAPLLFWGRTITKTVIVLPPVEYVLLEDAYVLEVPGGMPFLEAGTAGQHGWTRHKEEILTPTLEEYRIDPSKWKFVKGVMTRGTKIRHFKSEERNVVTHTQHSFFAEVLDGAFKGKTVDFDGIRNVYQTPYLEEVISPATSASTSPANN